MEREQTKTVNYTSMFKAPISFRIRFRSITIPYTFEINEAIIYAVCFIIIQKCFGSLISLAGSYLMLSDIALTFVLPAVLTKTVQQAPTDGKRIDQFLVDMFFYIVEALLVKRMLYKGRYRQKKDQPIVFIVKNS